MQHFNATLLRTASLLGQVQRERRITREIQTRPQSFSLLRKSQESEGSGVKNAAKLSVIRKDAQCNTTKILYAFNIQ